MFYTTSLQDSPKLVHSHPLALCLNLVRTQHSSSYIRSLDRGPPARNKFNMDSVPQVDNGNLVRTHSDYCVLSPSNHSGSDAESHLASLLLEVTIHHRASFSCCPSAQLSEFSYDFFTHFRCSFVTSRPSIAKWEHAKTLRLRSDLKEFHARRFDVFCVFSPKFDATRL